MIVRRKAEIVEALQFLNSDLSKYELKEFMGKEKLNIHFLIPTSPILILDNGDRLNVNDWVVKDKDNQYYGVDAQTFKRNYELL